MGYYQGDYYAGTAGDPFLGGLFRAVGKIGKWGFSKIAGIGGGKAMPGGAQTAIERIGAGTRQVGGLIKTHPVISAAGGAGIIGAASAAMGRMSVSDAALAAAGGQRIRGFHMSKKKPHHLVRNRYMNPCNGKALKRAIRRAHRFERIAKHVIGFSSPRKPRGHMYFKRRRKK